MHKLHAAHSLASQFEFPGPGGFLIPREWYKQERITVKGPGRRAKGPDENRTAVVRNCL